MQHPTDIFSKTLNTESSLNCFNNLALAISTYQQAMVLLFAKISTNKILYSIPNQLLTKFFSESINIYFDKTFTAWSKYTDSDFKQLTFVNQQDIEKYTKKTFEIYENIFQTWSIYSTYAIQSLYGNYFSDQYLQLDLLQKYNALTDNMQQHYNQHISTILSNLKKFTDSDKNHYEHSTIDFIWNEFSKICNPKNIPTMNQDVITEMHKTSCANLVVGAKQFLNDVVKSPNGYFVMSTVDTSAFELGKNIAATPGKVVYQNKLMQLICYENTTKQIHQTPVLIVTAWINKYYILDLDPQYSFIKWLIDNGHRVFVISWINPDASMSNFTLTDYLKDGVVEALKNIIKITNVEDVNCIGYCMGGTLLAIGTAYLTAKKANLIKSITLLTALVDFEDCGAIKMFINNEILNLLEDHMQKDGYLDGAAMFSTFSALKSSEMIWYYFVNNYLMGKNPSALDVLYWNSDSTRIPYKMHTQCLRDLYQKNMLAKKQLILDDILIDLNTIECPAYIFATHDDHIAPWQGIYSNIELYGSNNKKFVLSKSGHVAAVINHPLKNKYGYWTDVEANNSTQSKKKIHMQDFSTKPDVWLNQAEYKDGSWWIDWKNWMIKNNLNGNEIKALAIPSELVIENAPGNYVKIK
jgi:polyhydroxyalkanoate synthase